jgi:hypothetical protein
MSNGPAVIVPGASTHSKIAGHSPLDQRPERLPKGERGGSGELLEHPSTGLEYG